MTSKLRRIRILTACGAILAFLLPNTSLAERHGERDEERLRRERRERERHEDMDRREHEEHEEREERERDERLGERRWREEREEREHHGRRRGNHDEGWDEDEDWVEEDWDDDEEWEGDEDWDEDEEDYWEDEGDEGWRGGRGRLSPDAILGWLMRRFPEEERDGAMEMLRHLFPGALEEFEHLARRRPEEAEAMMDGLLDEVSDLLELRQNNPEVFELVVKERHLEAEAEELAERCRRSRGKEREEAKQAMRELLVKAFGVKQELTKAEIQELAAELEELKQLTEKRQANREAIVERRLRELTGEDDEFDW